MTKLPNIAFSGPNAGISGLSYGIEDETFDRFSINIIPERDIVPMVDDPPLVSEKIRCIAKPEEGVVTCHSILRTACELMIACGSRDRPAFQGCEQYGYEAPLAV